MPNRRQDKKIDISQNVLELIKIFELDLSPEDVMQIDLLQKLLPSGGYENSIRAIDALSRYVFGYPVTNPTAVNSSKVIIDNMSRHAYLSALLISDRGSVFSSNLKHKRAEVLGINTPTCNNKPCTPCQNLRKNACYIKEVTEKVCSRISQAVAQIIITICFKIHQNISHLNQIVPSQKYHSRVPYIILDHKVGLKLQTGLGQLQLLQTKC